MSAAEPPIRPATPADLEPARRLLERAALTTAGFESCLGALLVARGEAGALPGCVGLELYGEEALLRSLAVAPEARGTGLGRRLVTAALELARARGARRVWLLTETADRFFPRFGFCRVERAGLPRALDASAELSGACPASAVAMGLEL